MPKLPVKIILEISGSPIDVQWKISGVTLQLLRQQINAKRVWNMSPGSY